MKSVHSLHIAVPDGTLASSSNSGSSADSPTRAAQIRLVTQRSPNESWAVREGSPRVPAVSRIDPLQQRVHLSAFAYRELQEKLSRRAGRTPSPHLRRSPQEWPVYADGMPVHVPSRSSHESPPPQMDSGRTGRWATGQTASPCATPSAHPRSSVAASAPSPHHRGAATHEWQGGGQAHGSERDTANRLGVEEQERAHVQAIAERDAEIVQARVVAADRPHHCLSLPHPYTASLHRTRRMETGFSPPSAPTTHHHLPPVCPCRRLNSACTTRVCMQSPYNLPTVSLQSPHNLPVCMSSSSCS